MRSDRFAAALAAASLCAAGPAEFRPADPGHRWEFPRDHFAHPGHRNEWWYFTGLVAAGDEPGRRLGFQVTFFRIGILPVRPDLGSAWAAADAVMAHLAVTDLATGAHVFSEVLWRAAPPLGGFGRPPGPLLAWARAPPGTEGRWTLSLEDGSFAIAAEDRARGLALRLRASPVRPVALQGPNGYSRKSSREGFATLYYSHTRLDTAGTIELGGRTWRVRGESWMDREIGSSHLAPEQVGWDWFGLRLADGRDLVLYRLRRADGSVDHDQGGLVGPGGAVRALSPGDFAVQPTGSWTSPATGARYPSGWRVEVAGHGLSLRVEPEVARAENRSALAPGLFYWEGPVRVLDAAGRRAGEGYVELTGYGEGSRLPL
jgi:predicted secreted hydrolase